MLVAVVDGHPLAALGVDDGGVIADPFRHTGAAVELVCLRVTQPWSRERRGLLQGPPGGVVNKVVQWL